MIELETKQENKEEVLKPVSYAWFFAKGHWCEDCLELQPQTKAQVLEEHHWGTRRKYPGIALPYQPFN